MELKEKLKQIENCLLSNKPEKLGLYGGALGTALFFIYYYQFTGNKRHLNKSLKIIDTVSGNLDQLFLNGYSLSGGISGLGWLIQHIENHKFFETNSKNFLIQLDELIYPLAEESLQNSNYDYLHGGLGAGLYFLSRCEEAKCRQYLENYVQILDQIAIKNNNTYTWEFFQLDKFKINKEESNLGLSHGIPSILMFLVKVYKKNILPHITLKLINGAVKFILNSKQDVTLYKSFFPTIVKNENHQPSHSRLAWCYGDMGVIFSLWHAAHITHNNELKKELKIMMHFEASRIADKKDLVFDAGFCHGTSGIAYMFRSFYLFTKKQAFTKTATYWYDETLKMSKFEDGPAGYKSFKHNEKYEWIIDYSLIEGITGIGLSLLNNLRPDLYAWDELFLLH